MSRKSISARHRATPTQSIALQGLAVSLKSNTRSLAKPAAAAAAASGLIFGVGAPAHAGAYAPEDPAATSVTAQSAVAPAAAAGAVHTVVPGDTLGAISASYGVELSAVLAANGLSLASIIFPGDQIAIPGAGSVAPAPEAVPAPAAQTGTIYTASSSITPAAAPAPAVAASGAGGALVASAYAQLGATQDCTVLVEQALRSIGKSVGDVGPTAFYQYGTAVSSPAPGDLVVSAGHVGIYVGDGQVISSGMNGVNETIVHPLSWLSGSSFVRVA